MRVDDIKNVLPEEFCESSKQQGIVHGLRASPQGMDRNTVSFQFFQEGCPCPIEHQDFYLIAECLVLDCQPGYKPFRTTGP